MQIEQIADVERLKKMLHAAHSHRDRLELNTQETEFKELEMDILRIQMRLEELAPEPPKTINIEL